MVKRRTRKKTKSKRNYRGGGKTYTREVKGHQQELEELQELRDRDREATVHTTPEWLRKQRQRESERKKATKREYIKKIERSRKFVADEEKRAVKEGTWGPWALARNLFSCGDQGKEECPDPNKGKGVFKKKRKTMRKHKTKRKRKTKRKTKRGPKRRK